LEGVADPDQILRVKERYCQGTLLVLQRWRWYYAMRFGIAVDVLSVVLLNADLEEENTMFNLTVTNNGPFSFFFDGGNRPFTPGQTYQFPQLAGLHIIQTSGMGDVLFVDLGEKKLDPYTTPKIPWTLKPLGGVIRYRGLDAYFRYQGVGNVTMVIDLVGSISVHFDQGGMMVNLDDMTVK